ncbi:transcriptional regulatory protein YycF [Clostridium pasteurianum DSM 525 = ATCC 6013]|uniref:Stage 0 sporulation protein A homolog n=1 Tax=Clostridium pasteurianum DSM 525 = ATCC 6013 TaxID=1262449 RepID=A0A0H3J7Q5_CLOPA|nr:response regulator transcription factor [Clostridium pasteurianum]AJA49946.1 transcriptional regulatory protein YycF [Clostridium pasteurianum DSM 525 = ATCC 6013]AJA53934.1 transcriptional regulatory protein YycF [Clostridium pasteurianum DSM 525 = ATCC 6013]AOZ77080.1 XRE family transcriptional regulator [Clostridium pasteurianum DSM 525 = ATCC 6013]AOZ80877.1 XRE family transcriptional regulator [Clostridium pasteurianum]ELP59342.1 alkaline phosphatase synthesis transcriptional regulator
MDYNILVVEDEFSINDILTVALTSEGYKVKSVFSSKEARRLMEVYKPDLILLDINLPDESGFELCRYVNAEYKLPVIMLTARNDVIDRVLGLELGADDYITKPFNIKEVMTRVKVALRRVEKYSDLGYSESFVKLSKEISINLHSRKVFKNDEEIKLKPKEYELLVFLLRNKNRVFSREEIWDKVWGMDYEGELRTIDVHVRRLRARLQLDSGQTFIETIFGVGYALR